MSSETLKQQITLDDVIVDNVIQSEDLIIPDEDGNREFDENLILLHAFKELTDKYNTLLKIINPIPTNADYKKAELQSWLTDRGISWDSQATKSTLLSQCVNFSQKLTEL